MKFLYRVYVSGVPYTLKMKLQKLLWFNILGTMLPLYKLLVFCERLTTVLVSMNEGFKMDIPAGWLLERNFWSKFKISYHL